VNSDDDYWADSATVSPPGTNASEAAPTQEEPVDFDIPPLEWRVPKPGITIGKPGYMGLSSFLF